MNLIVLRSNDRCQLRPGHATIGGLHQRNELTSPCNPPANLLTDEVHLNAPANV
jgi:hypothetical protein